MILKLHQQYGPVVRVGSTHVSIHHPNAHESVKSNHKSEENPKDPLHNANNRLNIIGFTRVDHQRYRRVLAHGFSAQTMLDQQPIIRGYVDKLIQRLHETPKTNTGPIDLEKWFNFTTFDIIGDLTFGEPFGCLEDGTYHPWINIMFKSVKNMFFLTATSRLLWLAPLYRKTILKNVASKLAENQALTREKAMTFPGLTLNAFALITAGFKTTATAFTEEVLSTFSSESQIDLLSVQKLLYMTAILSESMRLYPPAPGSQPCMAKQGGTEILGYFIPEGKTMDTWQWALYHNPEHFSRVEEFIPERWLGDPRFDNDAKKVVQPFSVGYRNCIRKNLANAEMRLVLSRLIWNFEIRAAEGIYTFYEESEVHPLWQKGPMKVS
ncbi:cytochrome P450 [Colletotrichum somersetense]|nr:cytochrome P450 [Colletotrichum somersetense]